MSEKNENKSRRSFIQSLGCTGAGVLVGSSGLLSGCSSPNHDGKKTKVLTTGNKLVTVNSDDIREMADNGDKSYLDKRGREGIPGKKFVMVVDQSKCKNARKCMKACQAAHQLKPDQHHINVLEMEDPADHGTYYMPKPCQHCDNPQCCTVCPVDATFKRQDGIVLVDNDRCIGCRFCIAACPYSARTFNWTEPRDAEKYANVPYDMEKNVPQKKGTVTKCVFSADRLRDKQLPSCVSACPNGVYYFGDSNEDLVTNGTTYETVRLSKLLENNNAYTLMPELGMNPNVYYLPHKHV